MNIYAIKGHRVRFTAPEGGWHWERDRNLQYLKPGAIYIVERTVVHSSSTDVYLLGPEDPETRGVMLGEKLGILEGKDLSKIRFNSVCFEDVEEQSEEKTKSHPDLLRYQRAVERFTKE